MAHVTHDSRGHVLELRKLSDYVASLHKDAHSRERRLQLILLGTSVLTSGALWLLLSHALPSQVEWIGAVLSTIATGVSLYQLIARYGELASDLLQLHRRLGTAIANLLDGQTMSVAEVEDKLRDFWNVILSIGTKLGYSPDPVSQMPKLENIMHQVELRQRSQ